MLGHDILMSIDLAAMSAGVIDLVWTSSYYATMGNWRVYTRDLELMHLVFLMDAACGEGGVWMQVLYACLHIH